MDQLIIVADPFCRSVNGRASAKFFIAGTVMLMRVLPAVTRPTSVGILRAP
jgi:hypothetical protein